MAPHWNRIPIRVASIALLVAGLAAGVHLGGDRPADTRAALVVQADADDDMLLMKRAHAQDAAARAYQREAEGVAANRAAVVATRASGDARNLAVKFKAKKEAAKKAKEEGTVPYAGEIPGSCKEYSGNRATGCALMLQAGFGIDQFPCLDKIFTKESGWNHKAENKGSGAYGIPQALPGSKMSSVASDWRTNPATQIKWGLGYIKGRYNSPCGAWSYWSSHHSY